MKNKSRTLYIQVIIAIVAGIALGALAPQTAVDMKPLGDAFIKLVKMLIGPIIFCTVVTGITGMGDMKEAGRIAIKALIYFTILSIFSLFIGMVVANVVKPGAGMNIDAAGLSTAEVENYTGKKLADSKPETFAAFMLNVIPATPASAFAGGEILQILFFAVIFACGTVMVGKKASPVIALVNELSDILFAIIGFIMKIAPLGAFGAMAFTVGKYGLKSLIPLSELLLCFYITCAVFIFFGIGGVLAAFKINIFRLLAYIKDEIFIVFGTSSSETALPRLLTKLENLGCDKSVVGMVLPTGYSFNLDGTAIYLTMAAIFLAQATNTPMSLAEQILLLGVMMLTSKGAAGVTGAGFITLAASLGSVGHIPVSSIALILGIDRFMSQGRSVTNLIGNAAATVVIAKIEGELDVKQANAVLSGKKA